MSSETKTNRYRLPERLKELRSNESLQNVSNVLEISRASLGYYESGERKPDAEILYRIAKYYNVSCDYLLGLNDEKSNDIDIVAINKKLGLSGDSITKLERLKKENQKILSKIIEHNDFEELMLKISNHLHSTNAGLHVPDMTEYPQITEYTNDEYSPNNLLQPRDFRTVYKFIINETLNSILDDIYNPIEARQEALFNQKQLCELFYYLFCYIEDGDWLGDYEDEALVIYSYFRIQCPNHPIAQYKFTELKKNPKEICKKIMGKIPTTEELIELSKEFNYEYKLFDN